MDLSDAELYEKYADELIRFATGLVGPHESQDIVSTAVLSSLSTPSWSSVANKRAYLYRSVFNTAKSHGRSSMRRRAREERVASPSTFELPEIRPDVLEAVEKLSVQQRATVFLTYWNDMSIAQVADLLDIGEGSVKRHLARARANLRKSLHE